MKELVLPHPWWVILAALVPALTYYFLRKWKLTLGNRELLISALFGFAFAFVEASIVIYLRAITGLVLGRGSEEVVMLSSSLYQDARLLNNFPIGLLKIEVLREAATIVMLGCVAWLTVRGIKERLAVFLWVFATWDACYYLFLWITVGWPSSLTTADVLFLIPSPWLSQVWFPILVSSATLLVVIFGRANPNPRNDILTSKPESASERTR